MAVAAASGLAAGAAPRVEPIVRPLPLAEATRKAGLAALVMLGLSVPITAIRTDQSPSGLLLIQRPHIVALAILIVFAFALAHAVRLRRPERLGGPGLANRAAVLLGLAALFAGAHAATTAVSARVGAALLPGVPLALMPEAQWFVLSAVILGLLLIQGAVVPLVPGLVEATRRKRASSEMDAITTRAEPASRPGFAFARLAAPFCLGLALLFPLLAFQASGGLSESRYWIDLGILILTYVMLGWGLNIVVGLAGLLDLGYVAFYAVGAYSYALLATTFGLSFWICLPVAGLLAAFWGILLGFPVLRLRGDYLAIVTLAFGEIIRLVLINWVDVTGGGAGISSIPRVTFFGVPFTAEEDGFAALFGLAFSPMHRIIFLYYLILALALLTNLVTVRLRRLPIGRAWEALREDEIACRSLGINTTVTKLTAFAIGAMFGGFAGSFFAVRQGFISPESFNFLESATILAIVVLGGMGSQIGVAIAALAMTAAPELLRNLDFLKAVFGEGFDPGEYRLLLFGLAMVLMMIWRPRGLVSVREPSVILKERKSIAGSHVREGHG